MDNQDQDKELENYRKERLHAIQRKLEALFSRLEDAEVNGNKEDAKKVLERIETAEVEERLLLRSGKPTK